MRHAALALVLLALPGCKKLPGMSDLKKVLPEVRFDTMKIEDLDFQALEGRFVLDVDNPYPVKLDVQETSWKLGLAGNPFLDGTNREGTTIEASGTSKVRIPFTMRFADAFAVARDAADADELPYTLDVTLGFDSPVGPVSVPLKHRGELPALHLPKVTLKALRIEGLDLGKQVASLALDLQIATDQPSPLSFDAFTYDLKLAGSEVANGTARIGQVDGRADVTVPIDVQLVGIGAAALEVLTDRKPTKVRLTADATVGTPFGDVPLAIDESADLTPR